MNFTTHTHDTFDIGGTSLQGAVTATYNELTSLFGKPTDGDGYKVDAEWIVRFDDGTVATIYNWKNGVNYCGKDGTPVEQITEWHVGGASKVAADRVQIALDLHREKQEDAKPKHKIEEAFASAMDIMETLKKTRGDNYARAVEVALLTRKQHEMMMILAKITQEVTDMPQAVFDLMTDSHKDMGIKIIARFMRGALPEVAQDEQSAK